MTDNESLEFLGDAVLGLVVADTLFRAFPTYNEGQKSKIKANLVSTRVAGGAGRADSGLGDHMILGRGEEKTGGRRKQALLADTCEALIAAIYLDGGLEPARKFLMREFSSGIEDARQARLLRARSQVAAAGAAAGAGAAAAVVSRVRRGRPRPSQDVSRRGGRRRRQDRRKASAAPRRKPSRKARDCALEAIQAIKDRGSGPGEDTQRNDASPCAETSRRSSTSSRRPPTKRSAPRRCSSFAS